MLSDFQYRFDIVSKFVIYGYTMLRIVPLYRVYKDFYRKWMLYLIESIFSIYSVDYMIFTLQLVNVIY